MTPLKRYQLLFLVLLGGALVLGLALNTWVNPLRVTPTPWSAEELEPYRAIEQRWNRTAKAGLAKSGDWQVGLFGSSRVDIALDPEHPSFGDRRVVNLGLNAALILENRAIFDYFLDHQAEVETVIFALDPGDLSSPPPPRNLTDFALSPLEPGADPVERELRYLAGGSTLAASAATLARASRDEPAEHTPEGFRRHAPFPDNQRALIASLYLSTTYRVAKGRIDLDGVSEPKLAALDAIIERCRQRGIELILLLTPNHVLFQLAFPELGSPDPWFEGERRLLAERAGDGVVVWDFLDAHPLNADPLPPAGSPGHMEHWIDLFHATPEVGAAMLERIHGGAGDFGVRLGTPEAATARAAEVEAQLEDHAARHPDDLEFLRRSLEAFEP